METHNGASDHTEPAKLETTTWENFKIEDGFRGAKLEDIERRCLSLCQQYIGGSWLAAEDETKDIEVIRITGGLTNQIYKIALRDHVATRRNDVYQEEPRVVSIKFYQPKHFG